MFKFFYRKNKTTIFNPYKLIEKGGKKIPFIAVLTHLTFTITYLSGINTQIRKCKSILDWHTYKIYNVTSKDKNEKDIYIAQTGTKLQSIGKFIIKNDSTITSEIITEIPDPSDKTNATNVYGSKSDR